MSRFTRDWICCTWDTVYIWILHAFLPECRFTAFWTLSISWSGQYSCVHSEYLYKDILRDWTSKGSQDKDISHYQTLNGSQDTDICVLVDIGWITGQIAGYSGQTLLSVTVATSD